MESPSKPSLLNQSLFVDYEPDDFIYTDKDGDHSFENETEDQNFIPADNHKKKPKNFELVYELNEPDEENQQSISSGHIKQDYPQNFDNSYNFGERMNFMSNPKEMQQNSQEKNNKSIDVEIENQNFQITQFGEPNDYNPNSTELINLQTNQIPMSQRRKSSASTGFVKPKTSPTSQRNVIKPKMADPSYTVVDLDHSVFDDDIPSKIDNYMKVAQYRLGKQGLKSKREISLEKYKEKKQRIELAEKHEQRAPKVKIDQAQKQQNDRRNLMKVERKQKNATKRIKFCFIFVNLVLFYLLYFLNVGFKPAMFLVLLVLSMSNNIIWAYFGCLGMSCCCCPMMRKRSSCVGKCFQTQYWCCVAFRELVSAIVLFISPALFFANCEGGIRNSAQILGIYSSNFAGLTFVLIFFEVTVFSVIFFWALFLISTSDPGQARNAYMILTLVLLFIVFSVIPFWLSETDNLLSRNGLDLKKFILQLLFNGKDTLSRTSGSSFSEFPSSFDSKNTSITIPNIRTSQEIKEYEVPVLKISLQFITSLFSSKETVTTRALLEGFSFAVFWDNINSIFRQVFTIINFATIILMFGFNFLIGALVCIKVHIVWGMFYALFHALVIPIFIVFQVILSILVFFHYGEKKWTDGRSSESSEKEALVFTLMKKQREDRKKLRETLLQEQEEHEQEEHEKEELVQQQDTYEVDDEQFRMQQELERLEQENNEILMSDRNEEEEDEIVLFYDEQTGQYIPIAASNFREFEKQFAFQLNPDAQNLDVQSAPSFLKYHYNENGDMENLDETQKEYDEILRKNSMSAQSDLARRGSNTSQSSLFDNPNGKQAESGQQTSFVELEHQKEEEIQKQQTSFDQNQNEEKQKDKPQPPIEIQGTENEEKHEVSVTIQKEENKSVDIHKEIKSFVFPPVQNSKVAETEQPTLSNEEKPKDKSEPPIEIQGTENEEKHEVSVSIKKEEDDHAAALISYKRRRKFTIAIPSPALGITAETIKQNILSASLEAPETSIDDTASIAAIAARRTRTRKMSVAFVAPGSSPHAVTIDAKSLAIPAQLNISLPDSGDSNPLPKGVLLSLNINSPALMVIPPTPSANSNKKPFQLGKEKKKNILDKIGLGKKNAKKKEKTKKKDNSPQKAKTPEKGRKPSPQGVSFSSTPGSSSKQKKSPMPKGRKSPNLSLSPQRPPNSPFPPPAPITEEMEFEFDKHNVNEMHLKINAENSQKMKNVLQSKRIGPTIFVLVCCYQEELATIVTTYQSLMNYRMNMVVFLIHDGQENKARMDCLRALKQTIFKDQEYPMKQTKNYQIAAYNSCEKEKYLKKICLVSKKKNAGKRDSQLLFFNILNPLEHRGYPPEHNEEEYSSELNEIRDGLKISRMLRFLDLQELNEKKQYLQHMRILKLFGPRVNDFLTNFAEKREEKKLSKNKKKYIEREIYGAKYDKLMQLKAKNRQFIKELQRDYYLWLDMDTKITDGLLERLEKTLMSDPEIAVVCPHLQIRRKNLSFLKPLIWIQTLEMYISHAFYKSAEDSFGSVLCSPGACSLYRNECIRTCLLDYKGEPMDVQAIARKTLGEDRYLCTLFLMRGYQVRYAPIQSSSTELYAGLMNYYSQRRRWVMSTFANNIMLVVNSWEIILNVLLARRPSKFKYIKDY